MPPLTSDAAPRDDEAELDEAAEPVSVESAVADDFEVALRASLMAGLILRDDLTRIKLVGQKLPGLRLENRDLSGADFLRADLSGAELSGANLTRARLTNAVLARAMFCQANLSEASIVYAHAVAANFRQANLRSANLLNTQLEDAKLDSADLSEANLSGGRLQGAHLSRAKLREATLERAQFSNADLRDADLRQTNLRHVDLTGADLRGADLTGANLTAAEFTGATISSACFDATTWDPTQPPTTSGKPFVPLRWVAAEGGEIPRGAEAGGHEAYGDPPMPLYVARVLADDVLHVGKVRPGLKAARLAVNGAEKAFSPYEVLVGSQHWAAVSNGRYPRNAFEAGRSPRHRPIYVARGVISDGLHIGEFEPGSAVAVVPYGSQTFELSEYEILVTPPPA